MTLQVNPDRLDAATRLLFKEAYIHPILGLVPTNSTSASSGHRASLNTTLTLLVGIQVSRINGIRSDAL